MNIIFLNPSSLSASTGPLARFSQEMKFFSKANEITIVCLGEKDDPLEIRGDYKNISFRHFPLKWKGWEVLNINEFLFFIDKLVNETNADIVVLNMEIWDLMRELSQSLMGKTSFAATIHAMPFLGSPINPTSDFEKDVLEYADSGIPKYRSDYNLSHYKEANAVFEKTNIIANNLTVSFYLKNYFKNIKIWTQEPSIIFNKNYSYINSIKKYDFVYMARMEDGKGVEYLEDIIDKIGFILHKKVRLAILGRADDDESKKALRELTEASDKKYYSAEYLGWADNEMKKSILSNSSVFLYPSHYDNYPTVVNEALSFGLPCIVWDVPFYRLNYSRTKAMLAAPFLDFKKFAELSIEALLKRDEYSRAAINFLDSFKSLEEIAELDILLLKQIIKKDGEHR